MGTRARDVFLRAIEIRDALWRGKASEQVLSIGI